MRSILAFVSVGIVAGLVGVLSGPQPACANCCELIGCSNQNYFESSDLMTARLSATVGSANWIYKENGYCFKTPKAIKAFGNAGCLYDDVAQVPLNQFERYNVKAIEKAEAKKGC